MTNLGKLRSELAVARALVKRLVSIAKYISWDSEAELLEEQERWVRAQIRKMEKRIKELNDERG